MPLFATSRVWPSGDEKIYLIEDGSTLSWFRIGIIDLYSWGEFCLKSSAFDNVS